MSSFIIVSDFGNKLVCHRSSHFLQALIMKFVNKKKEKELVAVASCKVANFIFS